MSDVEYLLPLDTYQQHFVHIGTQQSSAHMVPFLEDQKQEGTGLYLINLDETNKRFSIVSNFLSKYKPENILVVSARQYGQRPARRFAQAIGARHIVGRFFSPGPKSSEEAFSGPKKPQIVNFFDVFEMFGWENFKKKKITSCGNSPLESPLSWRPIFWS